MKLPANINLEERKNIVSNLVSADATNSFDIIQQYSSFTRLIRVVAFIMRFASNCKNKNERAKGFLTTKELQNAHNAVIKISQKTSFAAELKILQTGKKLTTTHFLSSTNPFLDELGILRVGGRISSGNVCYEQKHPIILHKREQLTKLIVQHYHIQHCHAGKKLLYYVVHLKYWVPGILYTIKACLHKCTVCMRQRAKPYQQQMGNLPAHRLVPTPVFMNVGIDYAGPMKVRTWKGRGAKMYKAWIAIFVCLVTKAIHIELVTELTTAAFIAALRRFIARRGKPMHIYSDNGTNFVGANQYLREIHDFLKYDRTQSSIHQHLAEQQIQWHFSPPSGPHFGGIWEAGVKSIKFHLIRTLKDAHPTVEEMHTVLCQIESCLNSRPICNKFEGEIDALTPAHFIIMRTMHSLPDENLDDVKENRLNRWQYMQRLLQQFWRRWSLEYLHELQQRPKWRQKMQNLQKDDVVIIKDDNMAPSQWLMGKVIEVHQCKDGLIRVATLKTARGQLKRPITKLCPLFQDV